MTATAPNSPSSGSSDTGTAAAQNGRPGQSRHPRASFQSGPAAGGAGCNAPPAPLRPGHVAGPTDGLALAWHGRFITVAACGPAGSPALVIVSSRSSPSLNFIVAPQPLPEERKACLRTVLNRDIDLGRTGKPARRGNSDVKDSSAALFAIGQIGHVTQAAAPILPTRGFRKGHKRFHSAANRTEVQSSAVPQHPF